MCTQPLAAADISGTHLRHTCDAAGITAPPTSDSLACPPQARPSCPPAPGAWCIAAPLLHCCTSGVRYFMIIDHAHKTYTHHAFNVCVQQRAAAGHHLAKNHRQRHLYLAQDKDDQENGAGRIPTSARAPTCSFFCLKWPWCLSCSVMPSVAAATQCALQQARI